MVSIKRDDVPDNWAIVDVGSTETRAALIFSQVKESARHHESLKRSMTCALYGILVHHLIDLLIGAEDSPTPVAPATAEMLAEAIMENAEVNINTLLLIGECAELVHTHSENGTLPQEYYSLFPDEIEAG